MNNKIDQPILKRFDAVNPISPIYGNKTACFELHDCIIDLREFGQHAEHEQNFNLKAYCGSYRIRKYINRHPETNALWYNEIIPTYKISENLDEKTDLNRFYVDQSYNEVFFCYDYLEWQYSHFLTDVYPKMWYFPQLKRDFSDLKFAQIRPIINFGYNLNDKTLKTKLNLISYFAHDITDFYLKNIGYEKDFIEFKAGYVYHINKLFLPVPFTSQDVIGWPKLQLDMYNLLINESKKTILNDFPEKVFISRKDTVKNGWFNLRYCINEDEIFDSLIKYGFESMELMPLNIFEKIKVFLSAKEIIQTVGSNCFNTIFVKPNTKLYTIIHPHYVSWIPMLDHISKLKNSNFYPYSDGIQLLGLDEYPENYKRIPDQPWKLNNINKFLSFYENV